MQKVKAKNSKDKDKGKRKPPPSLPLYPIPPRRLYPILESRALLGGISHAGFYKQVREKRIHITKMGSRSFVSDTEIARVTATLEAESS